jgi:hypothetical protein
MTALDRLVATPRLLEIDRIGRELGTPDLRAEELTLPASPVNGGAGSSPTPRPTNGRRRTGGPGLRFRGSSWSSRWTTGDAG